MAAIALAMTDSRGQRTRTLVLTWVGFAAITARFLAGGLVAGIPVMQAWDYALASTAVTAWWLGREWMVRTKAIPEQLEGSGR